MAILIRDRLFAVVGCEIRCHQVKSSSFNEPVSIAQVLQQHE